MASLTSLPSDIIIDNIIPLLSVKEFLNFSSTCKAFYSFAYDEVYWRKLTTCTFRLPAQPLRENGWRELYKNLYSATLYTWGSNDKARLGHDPDCLRMQFPMEVDLPSNEVAVDVVMGGWNTTVLSASGSLYTWGTLSGMWRGYARHSTSSAERAAKLQFPEAHSSTKIVQVSSGRSHILGLSEDGRIWSWTQEKQSGKFIKFFHVDTKVYTSSYYGPKRASGTAERVEAGWNHSAAFINGVGIVIWFVSSQGSTDAEGLLVDGEVVPGTCYIEDSPKPSTVLDDDWEYAKQVGEVTGIMAGDSYLIFVTKPGNVYAVRAEHNMVSGVRPVQLHQFAAPGGEKPMTYVSGSFRNFAVFNSDGTVYIGTKDQVQRILNLPLGTQDPEAEESMNKPIVIPSLQKRGIVAIAFGDYHSLALTCDGKVLSWGSDSEKCGCLGHGPPEIARKKGVKYHINGMNGELDEPTEIRFDWFETNPQFHSGNTQQKTDNEYFVFNISAAGWHSGALALASNPKWRERTRAERLAAVYGSKPVNLFYPGVPLSGPTPTRQNQPHSLPDHPEMRVPGRFGGPGWPSKVPPGEMGHGPRVRPGEESPVQRGIALPDMVSSNPSPFICHGPVRPAPGAFPNPTPMTGGPLQMGEDDTRRAEEEQERRRNQGDDGQERGWQSDQQDGYTNTGSGRGCSAS